ncbi:MAG: APC family permease [Ignavibacteriales bacterium]|nr:APC family permease [Ignavibacteriales bacterium]
MGSGDSNNSNDSEHFQNSSSSFFSRFKRAILGAPRNIKDPAIFHRISLIAFLAWVGLGADGLSSSAYGPEETFRALGQHTYLAIGLALAMAFTIFIISYAYSRIIEHFPSGGGGYVVSSKLLGPKYGVVSGAALLVDYVLTISVSIASAVDQVFSILPPEAHQYKLIVVTMFIGLLSLLNMRGVKESVTALMPIFLVFLVTHAILIIGGIGSHTFEVTRVVGEVKTGFNSGLATLGIAGMFALFLRAYSMGAGTYTGIEAVSNGIQIMREPKIDTARRTMAYMALSLALTAGGILICYLLFRVTPEEGKTMNAVLLERFAGDWSLANIPLGRVFVIIALGSEAALLFVAAQAGFIDGPRVMSNMAGDSWMPHRFLSLSDRLTMQNGVILISVAAILTLLLTGGSTSTLILMYSINVFLTFSLSEMGMVRYWIQHRKKYPDWSKHIIIHLIGLVLCLSILGVNLYEKFSEGGYVTLIITLGVIGLCALIKRHYEKVTVHLKRLDDILTEIPPVTTEVPKKPSPKEQTAVVLVKEYGGLGIHSFLSVQRLFPNHFKNFIFISVHVLDAGSLKGADDLDNAMKQTEDSLKKYVNFAHQMGFTADYRMGVGTEVLEEAEKICQELAKEYPRSIFFSGKLVFERERWYQRFLHNETAYAFQRQLQFAGLNSMVLPVRVFETVPAT